MLRSLTARQFQQWMIYAELEPLEYHRADFRAAQIVTALMNIHRDPKAHPKPFTVEENLLRFVEEESALKQSAPHKQSWQEQKMIAQMFTKAFAATKQKRGGGNGGRRPRNT